MTLLALGLILASAFAHATWNYLAKRSRDTGAFTWCFLSLGAVLYLPVALYFAGRHPVPAAGWGYALGTMLLHVVYFRTLSAAYARADLSLVYPVARGTGVALVPVVAVVALGERLSPVGVLSILVVLAGILIAHAKGSGWRALVGLLPDLSSPGSRFALLTGLVIVAYSVWDKQAVGIVNPLVYGYFVFLGPALAGIPGALRRPGAVRRELREAPLAVVAAAVLSPLAYYLVLVALTFSQVSYVAASREIGIVVGALLGALALREPHGRNRLLGSAAITLGVVALALVA